MKKLCFLLSISILTFTALLTPAPALATTIPNSDFSIEVSPSPLAITVDPGKAVTSELKIRNAGLKPEQLKIEARDFTISKDTGEVKLGESTPKDLAAWVRYSAPIFTVQPGEWFTQNITITLPESAGFSYPFAVVISRAKQPTNNPDGTRLLEGSVAVFTLVNVNKPGATRSIALESIVSAQPFYEYLPAEIKIRLKNTGNSIVQPYGNVYIQRGSKDTNPLAVLPLNDARSYILPNTSKDISIQWNDGWPVRKKDGDKTVVDWNDESTTHFRFGKYTAKVVAVYNDGSRDVPVVGETTFWVIPWKLLLGGLLVLLLAVFGVWSIIKQITLRVKSLRSSRRQ